MNSEHEDRILDAGLEEVLGGHYPPDLSAKILQAWDERRAAMAGGVSVPPSAAPAPHPLSLLPAAALSAPEPEAPPVDRVQLPVAVPRRRWRQRSQSMAWNAAVAGGLLAVLISAGIYVARNAPLSDGQPQGAPDSLIVRDEVRDPQTVPTDLHGGERSAGPAERLVQSPSRPSQNQENTRLEVARDASPSVERSADPPSLALAPPAAASVEPQSDAEVVAFVDQMLQQRWREHEITAAPPASDEAWCRRVYVRLVGREATSEEVQRFLRETAGEKRERLVDELLASEQYAQHWADVWARVLQGPATPSAASNAAAEGLHDYLLASLRDDKPYDRMAAELISASGSPDPSAADYNGATGFLAGFAGGDHVQATDRVARVFLGKQLACARCHDRPGSGWGQSDFWELNAFFRQLKVRKAGDVPQLVDVDFHGETGAAKDAEIFYKAQDGRLRVAYPSFAGQDVSRSGLVADVNRRGELGRLIALSPDFRTAVVNRVWAELLEYGFIGPVDDAGPHNPPSHPQILTHLGDQLAARQFRLDSLVRWVVLSKAFGVADRPNAETWIDAPESGGRPLFARFYFEPKPPLSLYKSLMAAADSPSSASGDAATLARHSWSPAADGVPQIIDTRGAGALAGPRWLDDLADSRLSSDEKVSHLFQSVLARRPNARELTAAKLVLADRMNDRLAVREIWQNLLINRQGRPQADR